ncbi:MAG: hypothetical protein Q7R93_02135 [bacterium]|nr:hypothetical protein [bacterium]
MKNPTNSALLVKMLLYLLATYVITQLCIGTIADVCLTLPEGTTGGFVKALCTTVMGTAVLAAWALMASFLNRATLYLRGHKKTRLNIFF